MTTSLLPFRLAICGVDELDGYAGVGVSDVLSILNPDQPEPPIFARFGPHRRATMKFDDVVLAVEGHIQPTRQDVMRVVAFGHECAAANASHVLIHCFAGVSRSTAAAVILMAAANPGREEEAFAALFDIRPRAWPNSQMIALADALLQRDGALNAALQRYYVEAVRQYAGLADHIRSIRHRGHEVPDIVER